MDASILIVHFGDPKITQKCIKSIRKSDLSKYKTEIIVVDNTPNVNQEDSFNDVIYLKTKKNNYCHALNVGTKKAKGEFVVILNPDTKVTNNWLIELLKPFKNKKIGGVSAKLLFSKSKKINSLGIENIGDYYFADIGFDQEDDKNLKQKRIKYASGGCVAYRKSALKDVGFFDEDFVMYIEDVDMGIKMREKNYQLVVNPNSVIYHDFHGTMKGNYLTWYFCNRNRFLLLAKHFPEKFAEQIPKSHPFIHKQYEFLYKFVKAGLYKIIKSQPEQVVKKVLKDIVKELADIFPFDEVQNMINEIELIFNLRKPKICFYDHALHFVGGGQKYGCTIAEVAKDLGDVTLISNKNVDKKDLENWYDLKLGNAQIKIIELPINKKDALINPSLAETAQENPFAKVEDEVWKHDIFINVNMVPHVNALALKNIFLCHFPDGKKRNFFYPKKYELLVANSKYTESWIEKKWNIEADNIIYPPVDMKYSKNIKKENIILAVGRFEESGSKKQLEMAQFFNELCKKNEKIAQNWKLILAGGSLPNNKYEKKIINYIKSQPYNIQIETNISNENLKKLYAQSKIFWHACGLNQHKNDNPHLIEHFGMTTVEAMQNGCAPIVIDAGGQKEIVEHKKDGLRFKTKNQLIKFTLHLIKNEKKLLEMQKGARKKSKQFSKEIFQNNFRNILDKYIKELIDEKTFLPEAHDILKYKKLLEENN